MSLQSRPHAELSRIGIFFIVGIIIVAMSSDGFAQCDDTVSVYFGNGFGDVNNGALNDAAALYDHLIERLSASSVAPPCAVMLAHDSNAPFVRKVIQAATQGLATSDDIWKVLDGLIPATPAIQDAIRANIALFDPLAPTTVADLDTQVAAYRSDLLAGKQVVVVAHSQGNFFAIQALSVLNNDPGLAPLLGNFHVLSVASPASFAPRQYWITAFGDPIWQVVPLSLPWTTLDDSLCLPLVDWHCHLFPSYLDGKISGTGISDYVASFFKSSGPFGDIAVQVTLNGSPWESQPSDNISYVVQAHTSGPIVAIFGSSIPSVTVSAQGGGYTIQQIQGGPQNSHLASVTPSSDQVLISGQTTIFTLNFVSNAPPQAAFVCTAENRSAANGQTLSVIAPLGSPAIVSCDASASTDPNGKTIIGWEWQVDGALSSTNQAFTMPIGIGTHSISLIVTDSLGIQSAASTATATVTVQNSQFIQSGSMSTARLGHTATLLPKTNEVLIYGGSNGFGTTLGSAEIFSPTTRAFRQITGSQSRSSHTATLLPNGKVLIVGGIAQGNVPLASADLFDPTLQSFASTGALNIARFGHTATLLQDGRVLITGGYDNNGTTFTSAEIYSPDSETFSLTGNMTQTRVGHAAALLLDGRVLITGGAATLGGPSLSSAEIYDPATGQFTSVSAMNSAHWSHASVTLPDGRVVIVGGFNDSVEVFNPDTQGFTVVGHLSKPRIQAAAALLTNGDVLVTGGGPDACCAGVSPFNTTDLIHLLPDGTFSISLGPQMISPRMKHTSTVLPNGDVLLTGGETTLDINFGPQFLSTTEVYIAAQ